MIDEVGRDSGSPFDLYAQREVWLPPNEFISNCPPSQEESSGLRTLNGKMNSIALEILGATSEKSKIHKHRNPGLGEYVLGLAEVIAGCAIIAGGGALEVATCGVFTVGLGVTIGTGASLIGLGLATTAASAKDIAVPKFPKYDPRLDIVNKPKEKPRRWDDPGSPPIRGDEIVGDGTKSPYPGFNEWKGKGDPASGRGRWHNPETGQSLHPDLNHPLPEKPHWDYVGPDRPGGARLYPDGTWVSK